MAPVLHRMARWSPPPLPLLSFSPILVSAQMEGSTCMDFIAESVSVCKYMSVFFNIFNDHRENGRVCSDPFLEQVGD